MILLHLTEISKVKKLKQQQQVLLSVGVEFSLTLNHSEVRGASLRWPSRPWTCRTGNRSLSLSLYSVSSLSLSLLLLLKSFTFSMDKQEDKKARTRMQQTGPFEKGPWLSVEQFNSLSTERPRLLSIDCTRRRVLSSHLSPLFLSHFIQTFFL